MADVVSELTITAGSASEFTDWQSRLDSEGLGVCPDPDPDHTLGEDPCRHDDSDTNTIVVKNQTTLMPRIRTTATPTPTRS